MTNCDGTSMIALSPKVIMLVLFLIFTKSMNEIIGNLVILGITVVLTFLAHKRVTMTASYQDV